MLIEVKDVSKNFASANKSEGYLSALRDVSFGVDENEFVCIIGPSGCGKSTLLRILAGLEKPTSGRVVVDGAEVRDCNSDRIMVFQDLFLFNWMTVIDNVSFGLFVKGVDRRKRYQEAEKYVRLVRLEGFEKKYPDQLSGGMRQRVALARALCPDPRILLMDEPFGALDEQTRFLMQEELLRIWDTVRKTIVFVTHSIDEAITLADRIIVLTYRPGMITSILDVDITRPRTRESGKFDRLFLHMKDILRRELEKSIAVREI